MRHRPVFVAILVALVTGLPLAGAARAAEPAPAADRPERGIWMHTEYSRLTVPAGEPVRMDLTVDNRGRRDENVLLSLTSVPRGWTADVKGGSFDVTGVPVAGGKSRVLTFEATPDKGLAPGSYTFHLTAASADGALTTAESVTVTLQPKKASTGGELQLATSYPVLRGPTDSSFEFSLEVNNKTDADRMVNLSAEAPKGWEITIKPAYESKQITSLRIKPSSSQNVALELKPPAEAAPGEYPVVFHAATDRAQTEARLKVVLTGIYKLDASTATGRLSLDAVVGKPATVTLLVRNSGSAANHGIKLSGLAPENWKVEFDPKTVESLDPGAIRTVQATITPAAQALVGDYSVALSADGERSSKSVEMRVTAHAGSAWGWVGVGLIAVVIGGLGGLFTWLGRR